MIPTKQVVLARLMAKVEKDPQTKCWVFCGHWYPGDFGVMKVGYRCYYVRKVMAWIKGWCELWEKVVAHRTCRTPACCNPAHIEMAATQGRSNAAMLGLKLYVASKKHLTEGRIRCIELLLREGADVATLAAEVGIAVSTIETALARRRGKRLRQRRRRRKAVA